MKLTLALVKNHLRLPDGYTDDDERLEAFMASALREVADRLCLSTDELAPDGDVPDYAIAPVLMVIDRLYNYSSHVSTVRPYDVGEGLQWLLNLNRDYSK